MRLKNTTFLATLVLLVNVTLAQNKNIPQPELESGTIESQFDYIITKSSTFKDFQLIRKTSILKVKKNAIDSIKSIREEFDATKAEIAKYDGTISKLENEIVNLKQEIAVITEDRDSIALLGKNLDKSGYQTIMWSVIAVLLAGLVIFVLRFKSSNSVTKKTQYELEKVEKEYDEFRKKSLKKEQEIMRKLQDEINKNH